MRCGAATYAGTAAAFVRGSSRRSEFSSVAWFSGAPCEQLLLLVDLATDVACVRVHRRQTLAAATRIGYVVYEHNLPPEPGTSKTPLASLAPELSRWILAAAVLPVLLGWGAAVDEVERNKERLRRSGATGVDLNQVRRRES